MVINCLQLRDEIASEIKLDVEKLKSRGTAPGFAIIQIGNYPPSDTYVRVKMRKAKELGIKSNLYRFDLRRDAHEIEKLIAKLNSDPSIHGIIIQRPLPPELNEPHLQSLIDPHKDIDGLSPHSPFVNPLVQAVAHVLNYVLSNFPLPTTDYQLQTIVVGKGRTAGGPIYQYFSNLPYLPDFPNFPLSVTQIDSRTSNPDAILRTADLIISCVGKPNIIRRDNIKKGVVLISVGQHQSSSPFIPAKSLPPRRRGAGIQNSVTNLSSPSANLDSRLHGNEPKSRWHGDYDESAIAHLASFYTPTPRGIGPLNVIFLLKNVIISAEKHAARTPTES